MAFTRMLYGDRVWDTTVTTGIGDITLANVSREGYTTFTSSFNDYTHRFLYCIAGGAQFEVGVGYLSAPTILVREQIYKTSGAFGSKVNFAAGEKEVFVTPTGGFFGGMNYWPSVWSGGHLSDTQASLAGTLAFEGGVASAAQAIARGPTSIANLHGMVARSSGRVVGTAAIAQKAHLSWRGVTENATQAALTLDGSAAKCVLAQDGRLWVRFELTVMGVSNEPAEGDMYSAKLRGVCRRLNAALVLEGAVVVEDIMETAGAAAWDVTAVAATGNVLDIMVTGDAAKSVNWYVQGDLHMMSYSYQIGE